MGPGRTEPTSQEGPQALVGAAAVQARRALTAEGLPRIRRLTSARDMQAVLRNGQRRRFPRLDIYWRGNQLNYARLGVMVPLHGRTAVERNRLRRRLRELARRHVLPNAGAIDIMIRSGSAAYAATFDQLAEDLSKWLRARSA